ncbi:MAG: HD domain-containing protein [Chloroflexota bacterium]
MRGYPPLPKSIAGIRVPQDDISARAWSWAHANLPDYLLTHSIRAYCWGGAIAEGEGWSFDAPILWTAALLHDFGLTTIPRNKQCFEVEGAEVARRFVTRYGMPAHRADRVAAAIVMHMQPTVTLEDGVESVLLDRATGLDVRGDGFDLVDAVRPAVMAEFPRRAFDRRFLAAIRREVTSRQGCQSDRLLNTKGLAAWMDRSPWRSAS